MHSGSLRPRPPANDFSASAPARPVAPEFASLPAEPAPLDADVAPRVETAHRAVEATLDAIGLLGGPGHPSMKLQFSVGGEQLLVRVEWQGTEVRTTFHTDSAELQAALSREWDTVVAPETERGVRLAQPQFAGFGEPLAGGSGQDRSDGRRRRAGAGILDDDESITAIRRPAGVTAEPAPARTAAGRTSRHLHQQA